jgi:hypothetical protein
MKRSLSWFLFAVLFTALAVWAPEVDAFSGSTAQCRGCHNIWTGGPISPGHAGHLGLGLPDFPSDCNACHVIIGDSPNTTRCGGCHVVPGLAKHHDLAGATGSCVAVGCHPGVPAPENTPVPGYATITAALDPCDGSEERFASRTISLDNDGDLLYDADDPDCQPAAPRIGVAPLLSDYGEVTIGDSPAQVFTISNVGTGILAVSGMTLTDTTNFSLDTGDGSNPCGSEAPTIPAGGSCTVSVAFVPQSVLAFSATYSIASNDGANPTVNVPLTGNGVASPVPNAAVSPASVDFGRVNVGSPSFREVTLSNVGSADLAVSGIALSDATSSYSLDLSGGSNPCGSSTPTIAPADSCTIEVTFAPTADGGPFGATVTVSSNDPDSPNAAVSFTGTGFLDSDGDGVGDSADAFPDDPSRTTADVGGGGGCGGGGCSVTDVGTKGGAGAVLGPLALLAMFAGLRRRKAKARR